MNIIAKRGDSIYIDREGFTDVGDYIFDVPHPSPDDDRRIFACIPSLSREAIAAALLGSAPALGRSLMKNAHTGIAVDSRNWLWYITICYTEGLTPVVSINMAGQLYLSEDRTDGFMILKKLEQSPEKFAEEYDLVKLSVREIRTRLQIGSAQ